MEKQEQNNDHIYFEESRNRKRTLAELHEAMVKSKEDIEDDGPGFDPIESELDYYNL